MTDIEHSNSSVENKDLPSARAMSFEALADSYAKTIIITVTTAWTTITIIALIAHTIAGNIENPFSYWQLYVGYLIPIGLALVLAPMIARSRGYALREKDIHFKSGLIWQKTVSLPFNRIQHVELESGPLERFYKLSTLKFFTAGGGYADMRIPALTFETASKLRAYVIKKAGVDEGSNGDTNG